MINCVILGTGNIALDLLIKIKKNKKFNLLGIFGRNKLSSGVKFAKKTKTLIFINKIKKLNKLIDNLDIVFDATSAEYHEKNYKNFKNNKKTIWIDLTPSGIGSFSVPYIKEKNKFVNNFSCITCGAQSSIPILYSVQNAFKKIDYIEVVSTIAARSAGLATRLNIDKYLVTTENAIKEFVRTQKVKSILIINPAKPSVDMTTTISVVGKFKNKNLIKKKIILAVNKIKTYIKNYNLIYEPIIESNMIKFSIKIKGSGDYLPNYAGNLDIITSAAIKVAEGKFIYENKS
jgi:acetaldehyde dehydrogenase